MTCRSRILRILLARGSSRKEAVHHHCIILTISIQIHRPYELGAVVVALDDRIVIIEIEPYVGIGLCLVEERFTHLTFHTIDDSRHGILCVGGQTRRRIVGHLQRGAVHLGPRLGARRAFIYIISSAFWLLGQFAPRNQRAVCTALRGHATTSRTINSHHATSKLLLKPLGGCERRGQCQRQHHEENLFHHKKVLLVRNFCCKGMGFSTAFG